MFLACGTTHIDPKTGYAVTTPTPLNVILLICLVFEGLLFAIFTCIMFADQMQAIWHDETGIEQLKKETGKRWNRRQRWRSMRAVFGLKGFNLAWFSPFTRIESKVHVESNYTVWFAYVRCFPVFHLAATIIHHKCLEILTWHSKSLQHLFICIVHQSSLAITTPVNHVCIIH